MASSYQNIKMYEKEILEMKGKGETLREIGEKLGFSAYRGKMNIPLILTRYIQKKSVSRYAVQFAGEIPYRIMMSNKIFC
jgi:hypothetical protein